MIEYTLENRNNVPTAIRIMIEIDDDYFERIESHPEEDNICVSSSVKTSCSLTLPPVIACGDQTIISELNNTLPLYGISQSEIMLSDYDIDYKNAVVALEKLPDVGIVLSSGTNEKGVVVGSGKNDDAKDERIAEAAAAAAKMVVINKQQTNLKSGLLARRYHHHHHHHDRRILLLKLGIFTVTVICVSIILLAILLYKMKAKQIKAFSESVANSNHVNASIHTDQ